MLLVWGMIISFLLILFLVNKKVSIGISVISGGIVLGLFAGLKIPDYLRIVFITFSEKNTLELISVVIMISLLSGIMKEYGVMEEMVLSLEHTFKSTKVLLFIIPSLLSAFTAQGSAIVAAPIINSLGDKLHLPTARKAAINLYIRHIWYFILPISVPLLYASYISEISLSELIVAQLPLALICLLAGYLVYIKPLENNYSPSSSKNTKSIILNALLYSSPLLISIFAVIILPFNVALLLGCFIAFLLRRNNAKFVQVIKNSLNINIILAIAGIMFFKNIIGNIEGLDLLIENLLSTGIPFELLIILSTTLIAYAIANPTLLVGILYPIILPLVPAQELTATAVLIYTTGFAAYFISPVHLCQALTNEYFNVSTGDLYKEYKITVPIMFFGGLLTYIGLRLLAI